MFPFVLWPTGGAVVAIISQEDALVISAICVALPATIAACVGAYNAWRASREMRPNGGGSARDAIDAIAADVRELATDVRDMREDVRSIRDDQRSDHARITRLENP